MKLVGMKIEKNSDWSLTLVLNFLKILGFLVPEKQTGIKRLFLILYSIFTYTFINGIYVVVQAGDLFQIWGDISLMVSASFLLFTNVVIGMKTINVMLRNEAIQAIIDDCDAELVREDSAEGLKIIKSCNRETSLQLYTYTFFAGVTILGWGASAEKNSLPLRAWYPYDTSKSPAYELSYFHQIAALLFTAPLNISTDMLVTSLIAVCRCRLRLVNLSLRNLSSGILEKENCELLTLHQENVIFSRLKSCVRRHQAVLKSINEIQIIFTHLILARFIVSIAIICVTAYQLTVELHRPSKNVVRIIAMMTYLVCMVMEVYLYCYQGHQLSMESSEISTAVYECPWYLCSLRLRRSLLIVMVRSKRIAQITAGGFTSLSLSCFTSIIKVSYTFFTVLQQVEDRRI